MDEIKEFLDRYRCPTLYYKCYGSSWCCPDNYVCFGKSTCVTIAAIVGACIGTFIGVGMFIACVHFVCFRQRQASSGTIIQQQTSGTPAQGGQLFVGNVQTESHPLTAYSQPYPAHDGKVVYPPS